MLTVGKTWGEAAANEAVGNLLKKIKNKKSKTNKQIC